MTAYYNEFDAGAASWLKVLISRGLIAPGDVDTRSIIEVQPEDLRGYDQCHFFAGIGGWSYALRLAGWADSRFVWTGSCPCQPFSAAGKQRGSDDERHLWPAFFRLIRECRPRRVFGEQVAGASGLAWLDHVCADLEGACYAAAAADLPACSVGAPHRRQRLFWVADAKCGAAERQRFEVAGTQSCAQGEALEQRILANAWDGGESIGMGNAASCGRSRERDQSAYALAMQADPWSTFEYLPCSDGKARPTQPGLSPLVDGLSARVVRGGDRSPAPDADHSAEARVMRLKGYGNAIVPQVAAAFVVACEP